ncbi:MAG: hypothetical protein U9P50_02995 [Patescibacteria group bacterium]|nr:hypothetical protein [Patescibacteria group bacterium]
MLKIYKKIGETPLECLKRLARENPEYKNMKMTYAGRLDPMAEGELLVLVGKECKKKDKYLGLDKEYEFDVLFGMETDSLDILGVPNKKIQSLKDYNVTIHREKMERFLKNIKGRQTQKYPAFSSKTIGGKPMFELAKVGELEGKEIPEKEIEIYEADFLKSYWIKGEDLKKDITDRILLVKGDFRQNKILKEWKVVLKGRGDDRFLVSKMRIKCSSGTYIRVIAQTLGVFLDVPALTLRINRLKVFT